MAGASRLIDKASSVLLLNPSPPFDWNSEPQWVFFNSRWPELRLNRLLQAIPLIESSKENLWIATSGTQSGVGKWIGFNRSDFLGAAQSLAKTYQFLPKEIWVKALPNFHVGGLSIFARAAVADQEVIEIEPWDPMVFYKACEGAQWTSLVPTQLFDIVSAKLRAPSSLRGVFIGGARLESLLAEEAIELGWPLLPSFGMTEAASQVATVREPLTKSTSSKWSLRLLPHLRAKTLNRRLYLKGQGLARKKIHQDAGSWKSIDMLSVDGWLETEDLVELTDTYELIPEGRLQDWLKTRGELVSRADIETRFLTVESTLDLDPKAYALDLKKDSRAGFVLCLYLTEKHWAARNALLNEWSRRASPFERIERIYFMDTIPRSDLGKVLYADLPG